MFSPTTGAVSTPQATASEKSPPPSPRPIPASPPALASPAKPGRFGEPHIAMQSAAPLGAALARDRIPPASVSALAGLSVTDRLEVAPLILFIPFARPDLTRPHAQTQGETS